MKTQSRKSVFSAFLIVSLLIVSCEDNKIKKAETHQGINKSLEEKRNELLKAYTPMKGSQFRSTRAREEVTTEKNPTNARTSEGLTINKVCIDGDNTPDYFIDVAVTCCQVGVEWHIITPNNEDFIFDATGDLSGNSTTAVFNNGQGQIMDHLATPGTWTIVAVALNHICDFTGFLCNPATCCFQWQTDSETFTLPLPGPFASSGPSHDLDGYRLPYEVSLPPGYTTSMIVDIGIDYENDLVITWFNNGYRTTGTTADLDAVSGPVQYTLPPGYSISNIVAMDIDGDVDRVYTWYDNKKRSIGSSTDLDKFGGPVSYTLPTGYSASSIIDIAIDGNVNWSWVYFTNGKKCAGSTTNLNQPFSPLQDYALPCFYTETDIAAIACDGDENTIFAWYKH